MAARQIQQPTPAQSLTSSVSQPVINAFKPTPMIKMDKLHAMTMLIAEPWMPVMLPLPLVQLPLLLQRSCLLRLPLAVVLQLVLPLLLLVQLVQLLQVHLLLVLVLMVLWNLLAIILLLCWWLVYLLSLDLLCKQVNMVGNGPYYIMTGMMQSEE